MWSEESNCCQKVNFLPLVAPKSNEEFRIKTYGDMHHTSTNTVKLRIFDNVCHLTSKVSVILKSSAGLTSTKNLTANINITKKDIYDVSRSHSSAS